jgi:hypothetical protein
MWAALVAGLVLGRVPDLEPVPSRIVFASSRTTVSQLYSVEPSGGGLAQLTFGAEGFAAPLASPDGRLIAAVRGGDLWVMRADGSDQRLLARAVTNGFSWSASSRQLVFADGAGAISVVTVATGRRRQITQGKATDSQRGWYDRFPSLSPDGRAVAFVRCCDWQHTPAPGIALVVRRNGVDKVLTYEVSSGPVWSPDGKWIAITTHESLSLDLVKARGGTSPIPLASLDNCWWCGPGGMAWSPSGRFLAFVDGHGLHVVPRSGDARGLDVKGVYGLGGAAWSPTGDALAVATASGVLTVSLRGETKTLLPFGRGDVAPGIGWVPSDPGVRYQAPELVPMLAQVSPRELQARYPIRQISADGDRVAYWVCPHALAIWRPGDAQPIPLGESTFQACLAQPETTFQPLAYDLALAGDRLAYLWSGAGNEVHTSLMLATVGHGTEGVEIDQEARPSYEPGPETLTDVVGGGSALVYGSRGSWLGGDAHPSESIWRLDGERPVRIASRPGDLQPLAVDHGRILARRGDGTLELLDLDGKSLATSVVQALTARFAGDDVVVLVQGELRDYSASIGDLRDVWPLPDVRSSGRCLFLSCDGDGVRLRLVDAARGLALYSLDGTFHLLRLRDGTDATIPGATAAELTDAGLFYTYVGADPWPGRIRFVPFAELPV